MTYKEHENRLNQRRKTASADRQVRREIPRPAIGWRGYFAPLEPPSKQRRRALRGASTSAGGAVFSASGFVNLYRTGFRGLYCFFICMQRDVWSAKEQRDAKNRFQSGQQSIGSLEGFCLMLRKAGVKMTVARPPIGLPVASRAPEL